MLYDILRETQAYKELTKDSRQEGRKEGHKEGFEEGLEEGQLQALRQMLLNIVQSRFPNPKMTRLAKGQASIIDDPEVLQDLILKVSLAQTVEEAQKHLIDWPGTDDQYN